MNLAFVANLFNKHPGLEPLEEKVVIEPEADESQMREARGDICFFIFSLFLVA